MMRGKRGITFGLLAVVLAGVLLLSGCVTIRSEMVVNPDLSGYRSVILAMDKSMMDMMASEGEADAEPQDPFADIQGEFEDVPGATVEPYVDSKSGNEGVKITMPFKDLNELTTQKFSEGDDGLDTVTWSNDGSVYTLNFAVNTGEIAAAGAQGSGEDAEAMTPEEQAMQTQMMAAMGMELSYSIALPGKILDYSPKEGAAYDATNNSLVWTLDLSKPQADNIVVKWDNSAAPAVPSGAAVVDEMPAVTAPTDTTMPSDTAMPAAASMVTQVQAYADANMNGDMAAYLALTADGEMIPHPLSSEAPELFATVNPDQVAFGDVFAGDTMGAAEWTGTWTLDGTAYTLNGIDVLTFDANGKISAIQSFVAPAEVKALRDALAAAQ